MFRVTLKIQAAILAGILVFIPVLSLQAAVDPTRPPVSGKAKSTPVTKKLVAKKRTHWILTSTLVAADRRSAVINDTVVSPGDRIAGATVVAINTDSVSLKVNGQEITLIMLKQKVKTPSRAVNISR